jgi:hypothetical protein
MNLFKAVVAVAALLSLGAVQAQTITGQDIKADYETNNNASFSVLATTLAGTPGTLGLKSQDGYTGVGVQGATDGEIDWRNGQSESITLTFTAPRPIASFTLGLLFNGPEYNDVYEVARITINGTKTYTLTTGATENVATWSDGFNSTLVNYIATAGTQGGEGGAITVWNPFGNETVTSIMFAAASGISSGLCGSSGTSVCTNQSDYNVVNVTPVPEPETYALMLAGLAAVAFVARRRRPLA